MYIMGFPGYHSGRDGDFDPGLAKSHPEGGMTIPAPVFLPEISMDRELMSYSP